MLRGDEVAVRAAAARQARGAPTLTGEVRGATAVAATFSRRAQAAQPALIDGGAGAVWAPDGRPRAVFRLTITGGKIVAIDLLVDPERLRQLDVTLLND